MRFFHAWAPRSAAGAAAALPYGSSQRVEACRRSVFRRDRPLRAVVRHVAEHPTQAEPQILRGETIGLTDERAAAGGGAEAAAGARAVEASRCPGLERAVAEVAITEFEFQILADAEIKARHESP